MDHKVGIVIPSYNEKESITKLIAEVHQASPEASIVIVDDSPNLDTVDAIKAENHSFVHVIHRQEKGGRGSAVLDGLRYLLGQNCTEFVEMDADFSHPPAQIPSILNRARTENLDLLIASRYLNESQILNWPLSRKIFSKCSNILAKVLLRIPVNDYTNGYRYYSQNAAALITKTCKRGKGFIALSEILVTVYYSGLKIGEIPTTFVNRVRGESSLNHKEISNALVGLFKIYRLKRELLSKRNQLSHESMETSHRERTERTTAEDATKPNAVSSHGPNV